MNRDEIIEKIKKLLRMKRGGTQAEVETALNLARELAAKHGIDLDGVNPDDEDTQRMRPIGHLDAITSARIQYECKYAGLVAQQFFNVSVFANRIAGSKYSLVFVGTDRDREIAIYVFKFLVGHFRRQWKTGRGRCRNRHSFLWGMYIGICSKLGEGQEQEPVNNKALIQIERALARRKSYIAEHFGEMRSKKIAPDSDAEAAKLRGYWAGRRTEIRNGVKAGEQRAAEQLGANMQGQLLLQ